MPGTIDSPNAPPAPPAPGTLSTLVTAGANILAANEDRKAARRDAIRIKAEAAQAEAATAQARMDIAQMRGSSWVMPAILLGGAGLGLFLFMRSSRKSRAALSFSSPSLTD